MTAASIVQELAELGERLEAELLDAGNLGADESAHIMAAVRDARADLADLGHLAEQLFLVRVGNARHYVVEGLGELEIRRATKRTRWRHDELLSAVIARVMDEPATIYDPFTGELLPYTQIGHNVTGRLRECVSFGAGKVTGIRAIGLQPDEFCEEEPGAMSVQLPPRQLATPDVLGEAS